jgi:hypothetical protein
MRLGRRVDQLAEHALKFRVVALFGAWFGGLVAFLVIIRHEGDSLMSKRLRPQGVGAATPELMAAVGRTILAYSTLENSLYLFLGSFVHVDWPVLNFIFGSLHNKDRVDLIKTIMDPARMQPEESDALQFALKCFDICTENRHFLAHAELSRKVRGGFLFYKATNSSGGTRKPFLLTVDEIDDTATSMVRTNWYLICVWDELDERYRRHRKPRAPMPLPPKPPQPRKLSLSLLPADHPAARRPH